MTYKVEFTTPVQGKSVLLETDALLQAETWFQSYTKTAFAVTGNWELTLKDTLQNKVLFRLKKDI